MSAYVSGGQLYITYRMFTDKSAYSGLLFVWICTNVLPRVIVIDHVNNTSSTFKNVIVFSIHSNEVTGENVIFLHRYLWYENLDCVSFCSLTHFKRTANIICLLQVLRHCCCHCIQHL